jgi:hypothetical protein
MIYERFHVTFVGVIATLVDSVIVAEFAGYWLHRLLHSDKFPALSRGHLIHHFLIYGPRQPMRAGEYHDATDNRFSVSNVGVEWLVPSALILLFCWGVMAALGVPPVYLDDTSPCPEIVVSQNQKIARHSSPKRGQRRLHGRQLRHRLPLF